MSKEKLENILFLIEEVNQKLTDLGFQWGDILNLHRGYLEVHCPQAQEEYDDGGNPIFYYGPIEKFNK